MAFLVKIAFSKIAAGLDFPAFSVLSSSPQKLTDLWKFFATAPALAFGKSCG
jgi:hypothetical protein